MSSKNKEPTTEQFEQLSVEDVIKQLDTTLSSGLSLEEALRRISRYGYNEIEERHQSSLARFFKKFWGVTAWMLELIIVLSWYLGKFLNLYIISALLVFNAVLGFAQEEKANAAVGSLRKKLQISARVLRDGKWQVVPARELVPGDIIRMRLGDFVPADAKIIQGDVEVDKSALTGESLPVTESTGSLLYSGSVIRKGESSCVVISTGLRTYFGKTVQLVQIAKPKVHSEEFTSKVVKLLLVMAASLIAALFVFSAFKGTFISILPLSITLLVSAVPIALPVMFSITMALGSLELAKKGVLVTRLSASDDAAMMSVLCVDKTGTLTMNRLSLADSFAIGDFKKDDVILYGALSSNEANQDPIDISFINAAKELGLTSDYIQKKFTPFNPSTRRTEAVLEKNGKSFIASKGAVSIMTSLCKIKPDDLDLVQARVNEFSQKGYRTLAVAMTDGDISEMRLVGIAALYDKPREDSPGLISDLKDLGISTKMLTGDALPIARETAQQIGLGGTITNMSSLNQLFKSNQEKASKLVEESDGFAEIYPEDKFQIVSNLQSQRHVVGMTGDGINDAPALRQAEVGIAVSNATDVAKGAASVVLTNEGLTDIVEIVKAGRMIYQRIMTWTLNKIIKTFQIVVFVVSAFLLTGIQIVSTFDMILLIFLVDFVTLSISTDNVRWSKCPNSWNVKSLIKIAGIIGIATVLESLALLYFGIQYLGLSQQLSKLHTFSFDILLLSGIFAILIARERNAFWKSKPSRTLLVSIIADVMVCVVISILGMPGFAIIPVEDIFIVLGYCFLFSLVVNDFIKLRLIRMIRL
jgi:H+-transporting ATPase